METNCDHIGPRPVGHCVSNMMTQCILNDVSHRWFIQMTEYNDTNCTETVINKHRLPCLEDQNCQCGKGICPRNKIITIEQNNECIEKFKTIMFIKNHCIPGKYVQSTLLDNVSALIDSNGDDYSSINRIVLKCDKELQQLSYYEYDDEGCNGDPVFSAPEILMDLIEFPCINIHC